VMRSAQIDSNAIFRACDPGNHRAPQSPVIHSQGNDLERALGSGCTMKPKPAVWECRYDLSSI
jgi:hypothetical protein